MSNIMIQSVSNQTNQSTLPQGTNVNQAYGFSNVHPNQILSNNQQPQSGIKGVTHHLSDQQSHQVANNGQLYGFQQSNHQSSPIYSTDYSTIQTNTISGPNVMQHSVQQPLQNSNQAAFGQVNQLKQLHQRLLMQQMSHEQKPQPASISSFIPNSTNPISAQNYNSGQRSKTASSGPHGLSENLAQLLQQDVPLRPPQKQQQVTASDEVSTNINQKLIQLKEQLEKQQQIQQQQRGPAAVAQTSGQTKLQQQLRQHIMNQQKKSDKFSSSSNGSSGKTSPKSSGAKRDSKQTKKCLNGYSSGESSTSSSKMGHSTTVTKSNQNKRSFNQSSIPQDSKAMNCMVPSRIHTIPQQQAQKVQMYDHSTEQKRRRLQTASFKQNQVFHTSGNRLVPTLPLSILGEKASKKL